MGTQANFEDHGLFYANQDMVNHSLALSLNSGIIYDIEDAANVKGVSVLLCNHPFITQAKAAVKADKACWYGIATVMSGDNTLIWEY